MVGSDVGTERRFDHLLTGSLLTPLRPLLHCLPHLSICCWPASRCWNNSGTRPAGETGRHNRIPVRSNERRISNINFPAGRHQIGDPILDAGWHTAPGETGNRAGVRSPGVRDHGEDPQERRGCQNLGEARRGGGKPEGTHWTTRRYVYFFTLLATPIFSSRSILENYRLITFLRFIQFFNGTSYNSTIFPWHILYLDDQRPRLITDRAIPRTPLTERSSR